MAKVEKDVAKLKDGYAKIANLLLECLYRSEMTIVQKEIVVFVFRFTYGFGRDSAQLSYPFIASGIGRDLSGVKRSTSDLVNRFVLIKSYENGKLVLGVNNHIGEWNIEMRKCGGCTSTGAVDDGLTSGGCTSTASGGCTSTQEIQSYKEKRRNKNSKGASRPGDQFFPSLWDAYPKAKRDEAGKRFIRGKILEEIEENAEAVQAALEIYLSEVKDQKYLQKASDFFRGNWKQYAPDEEENTEKKGRYE